MITDRSYSDFYFYRLRSCREKKEPEMVKRMSNGTVETLLNHKHAHSNGAGGQLGGRANILLIILFPIREAFKKKFDICQTSLDE